jgi:hypothetical protein
MLQFRQNDSAAVLILTLTELVTLASPNYLFYFKHVTTQEEITFVKTSAQDESPAPARYNQFTIDANSVFAAATTGEWHYKVFEQVSASNVDITQTGKRLEIGKLLLEPAEDFAFDKYNEPQTFQTYNG